MKKTMLALITGAVVMTGLMIWANRTRHAPVPDEQPMTTAGTPRNIESAPSTLPAREHDAGASSNLSFAQPSAHTLAISLPVVPDPETAARIAFKQSMDVLLSSQSTHEQRQAAWKQLMDAGQLDKAIAQLQQLSAANPQSAEYADTLGEAYLKKCSQTTDIREQGILAMNADLLFDNALSQDPSNWEARYTKAVAMSHWPDSLNKGQDVVDNLLTLIQQQETMPSETQFALPYLRLGDQYQKTGDSSSALHAWQQGAALFPANQDLQNRLTSAK